MSKKSTGGGDEKELLMQQSTEKKEKATKKGGGGVKYRVTSPNGKISRCYAMLPNRWTQEQPTSCRNFKNLTKREVLTVQMGHPV